MSQSDHGLLQHQVKQIQNFVLVLIIVITFWLGFSSSSFLLVSQGILFSSFFVKKILNSRLKKSRFDSHFWDFFWFITSTVLISIFATINLVTLQTPLQKSVPGAIITIALSSLVVQIILIIGVEKVPLKMMFFRDNISWILVLVAGLIMQFSGWTNLDAFLGITLLMYLAINILKKLYAQKSESNDKTEDSQELVYHLDQEVVEELKDISKVDTLDNFNVIKIEDDYLVSGNLVVANNCSQEDIFEIKNKAKKVLQKAGFEDSTIEICYAAELKNKN